MVSCALPCSARGSPFPSDHDAPSLHHRRASLPLRNPKPSTPQPYNPSTPYLFTPSPRLSPSNPSPVSHHQDVSMNYDNRKFCIVATSAQSLAHIAPGRSHGVTVIKHRLVLAQVSEWLRGTRDTLLRLPITFVSFTCSVPCSC